MSGVEAMLNKVSFGKIFLGSVSEIIVELLGVEKVKCVQTPTNTAL
jgi:hypothetical protein